MRKFVLLFLSLNFYLVAYTQVIKGTILDQVTHEKILAAFIYFNGTFVGTSTDQNGYFELDITKNSSMPLTVSAIGYYSVTLTGLSTETPVVVYMKPKVYEMNDVVVSGKSLVKRRKINLSIFRYAFLGSTSNTRDCEITNESDITFNYDTDRDTLKVYASKPIVINNMALGYKVTYFLDQFELYRRENNSFYFTGNIIFNEDLTTDITKKHFYESNRETSYYGSRMHFFRVLWKGDLDFSAFEIKDQNNTKLIYKDIVFKENSISKYLKYPTKLCICYDEPKPSSYISFPEGEIYFEENGYFDPLLIEWEGQMAQKRIADWLPYEYSLKQ
ncbi:MAG TPA: carboxypeptidase-like regulatory domain-containing protein [Prolixibacteraceae bacterium]|nr:carboxypeptidase-like regulatory domain-containing protein [Prolixibacteraceae bacterium]